MKNLKKKQHYVWKHYLKPWTINNQICCKRLDKKFITSLSSIGQKRFFYESEPLTEFEYKYLVNFIEKVFPGENENMYLILDLYTTTANSNNIYEKKCGIEDVHSIIEGTAIDILNEIYAKDLSFFNIPEQKEAFSLFLGFQYTRTNKMRSNLSQLKLATPDLNIEKLSKIFYLFFGEIIRKWILGKSQICLLLNNTEIDFITGDQPVLNIKGNTEISTPVKEFELFYPITPKYAIFLSERLNGTMEITQSEVLNYNQLIANHSEEQLYAKSMESFITLKG